MKPERLRDLTVRLNATIRDAMAAVELGAAAIAVVTDESGKLLGVLTDGDLRRALLKGAALDSPVEAFMTRKCRVVDASVERADVLDIMRAQGIQQIPIVDADFRLRGLHQLREIVGGVQRFNWAVLMAGGRGKRLDPLTRTVPKPMLPVAGRPILERLVLHLVGFGFRRIFISVQYLGDVITEHFGNGADFGCSVEYLVEEQPLGTGGCLSQLPEAPAEPLVVMNGDLITDVDLHGLLQFHDQGGYLATVCVREYTHTVPYGVLDVRDGEILGITEKPTCSWMANAGVYVLNPDLVSRVPKNQECSMPELLQSALVQGERIGAFPLDREWIDVGHFEQLRRAQGKAAS